MIRGCNRLIKIAICCHITRLHHARCADKKSVPRALPHPAIVLARLQTAIEPSLFAAGFHFEGRNRPSEPPRYLYLEYSRQGELFRLSWDRRDSDRFLGFTAEFLGDPEGYKRIAAADLSDVAMVPRNRVTAEIQMRIDAFASAVNGFLSNLTRPVAEDQTRSTS